MREGKGGVLHLRVGGEGLSEPWRSREREPVMLRTEGG